MDKYKQYMNNPDYEFIPYNSEVEKSENALAPNGEFMQFDGKSHANGGIKTHLDPNTLIFSDKLKYGGKTFAALNKSNNTSKEDKILNDSKASNTAKQTAELMKNAKIKNSLSLFDIQESLKADKVKSYAKKMGMNLDESEQVDNPQEESTEFKGGGRFMGINPAHKGYCTPMSKPTCTGHRRALALTLKKHHGFHEDGGVQKYGWGGPVDAKGFPIDATGRRLSAEEQMGFNRPSYTYGSNATPNRLSTTEYGATKQFGLNDPNYNTIPTQTQLPKFVYNVGAGTSYEQQQQDYLNKNKLNIGTFAKGGRKGDDRRPTTSARDIKGTVESSGYSNVGNYNNSNETPYGSYKESTPNWFQRNKDNLYQLGFGVAQNAGQLAYLGEQGKKYDTQQFYNYTPSLLDPSAALRDSEMQNRIVNNQLRDASGGNAGALMSNLQSAHVNAVLNNDRIRQQYANQNAQIMNQGKQYNIGNRYMTDDVNARNKGQALSNYYNTIGSVGTNVAQGLKDNRQMGMDEKTIGMFTELYNNPEFRKFMENYKKK